MCFSMAWLQQFLIMVVIFVAVVAILKLLIPWLLSHLGGEGGIIGQVINILFWAVICIFVIYVCFAIISCLLSMGGGFPLLPRR